MLKKKRVLFKKQKEAFKYKTLVLSMLTTLSIGIFFMLLLIPELREIIISILLRVLFFIKTKAWAMFSAFVLINGKFVLKMFLKKLTIVLTLGLAKRYFIEKVFMKNLIELYIKRLPLAKFLTHVKKNFIEYSLTKKLTSFFVIFITALSGLNYFGDLMFIKAILAKFWSFLLFIFMKLSALVYFIILDSSWFRMLLEIILFGWLLSLLEKNEKIAKVLYSIYNFVGKFFDKINFILEKFFNKPTQKGFNYLTIKTSRWMHKFVGTEGYLTYRDFILKHREEWISIYALLQEYYKENPSFYIKMKNNPKRKSIVMKKREKRKSLYLKDKERRKKYDNRTFYLYLHKEHKI